MSILVVESSKNDREQLKFLLHLGGYFDLVFAESITEAFAYLGIGNEQSAYEKFDLILMDIFMPGMDGLEVCKRLKSLEYLKDIPIVAVTKDENIENMLQAFEAGVLDYVTKPLANKIELLPRINSALSLKNEMETRKAREKELLQMTKLLKDSNAELQKANAKLEELAAKDPLTNIANRRYFFEMYQKEFKRAQRASAYISIIMIDIDYFKAYNDYYGHQEGDECIKAFAHTLKSALKRPCDLVARYGGEEFIIMLAETDPKGALSVIEFIQRNIADLQIEHSTSKISRHVTCSIGLASEIPTQELNHETLISHADQALYKAKAEGRNRCRLHG